MNASIALYFAVLGSAALVLIWRWPGWNAGTTRLAMPFSVICIAICWRLILRFMAEQASKTGCGDSALDLFSCTTDEWKKLPVFELAYVLVCEHAIAWLWSSQLLVWVVPGCAFLHIESARLGVSHSLAYVLLGFLGAISASFPLFFAHVASLRNTAAARGVVPVVNAPIALCSIAAYVAVLLLPVTVREHRGAFNAALMVVHGVLAVPCLVRTTTVSAKHGGVSAMVVERCRIVMFYALLAGAAFATHIANFAHSALGPEAWTFSQLIRYGLLDGSDCVVSISLDMVFTAAAAMLYFVKVGGRDVGIVAAVLTPVLSLGVTFPMFLALREHRLLKDDAQRNK